MKIPEVIKLPLQCIRVSFQSVHRQMVMFLGGGLVEEIFPSFEILSILGITKRYAGVLSKWFDFQAEINPLLYLIFLKSQLFISLSQASYIVQCSVSPVSMIGHIHSPQILMKQRNSFKFFKLNNTMIKI